MPIYEYYCPACKQKFELLRSFSRSEEPVCCPECKTDSKKILSKFASFSKDSGGTVTPVSGSGGGCSTCGSSGCTSCGG